MEPIVPVELAPNDPAYAITGWPNEGACPKCGARAVLLVSTGEEASYECRGTAHGSSDYGDDRCGAVSRVTREAAWDGQPSTTRLLLREAAGREPDET